MLSAAGVCWFSLVLLILFLPEKFAGQAGVACSALMPARLRPYPVLSSPLAGPAVHKVLDFVRTWGLLAYSYMTSLWLWVSHHSDWGPAARGTCHSQDQKYCQPAYFLLYTSVLLSEADRSSQHQSAADTVCSGVTDGIFFPASSVTLRTEIAVTTLSSTVYHFSL